MERCGYCSWQLYLSQLRGWGRKGRGLKVWKESREEMKRDKVRCMVNLQSAVILCCLSMSNKNNNGSVLPCLIRITIKPSTVLFLHGTLGYVMKYEDTMLLLQQSHRPSMRPSLVASLSVLISVYATDSGSGPACIKHQKIWDLFAPFTLRNLQNQ